MIGFDLDGTLFEISQEGKKKELEILIDNLKKDFGEEPTKKFIEIFNKEKSKFKALKKINVPDYEEYFINVMDKFEFYEYSPKNEDIPKLINNLKTKNNLFLITRSRKKSAIEKLNYLGINVGDFKWCIFYDGAIKINYEPEFKLSKEKVFERIREIYPEEEIIYVGNSLHGDIIPAKKNNFKTIGINTPADFYFKNITESLIFLHDTH